MKYLPDVTKPAVDTRSYRGLQLDNELTVLLISDPETDISAAALSVHAGSLSDPWDLQGLAHFNEHMLFMGSEKYPDENEYLKFLSQNGGYANAYTSDTQTVYYFEVFPAKFEPALDRFSRFFIDPLLAPDCVNRELEAVNSEYQTNKEQDGWREYQISKMICEPTHDYSKFTVGNLETLRDIPISKGLNIRDELLKFNEKFYSANIMYLAVCGKESLDELEAIATSKFTAIKNRNLECKKWDNPFKPDHLMKQVSIVPIKDKQTMLLQFNFPNTTSLYKSIPHRYLSHLIGYEGKGSLLSELKELGLASSLGSYTHSSDGFGHFFVFIELTEEGLNKSNEVVKQVFQYINLLKKEGPQEYIFQELKDMNLIKFNFLRKSKPSDAVKRFCRKMHYYPTEDLISSDYLFDCYNPELISQHLEYLTLENCTIILTSKTFKGKTDKKDCLYDIDYKYESFSEDFIESIKKAGLNTKYSLPEPNTLIPTEFKIVSEKKDEFQSKIPDTVMKNPLRQVWHFQDRTYLLPRVYFGLQLTNPINLSSPHASNCDSLFPKLFVDALNEYLYDASLAGLSFYFYKTQGPVGYTLFFYGYNHKMRHFIENVFQRLVDYKIDSDRFIIQKEKYQQQLKSYKTQHLRYLVSYYKNLIMDEHSTTYEARIACLDQLTVEAVQQYWTDFTKQLDVDILIYGNIEKAGAEELVKIFDEQFLAKFNTKPLPAKATRRIRQVQLPETSSHLFETTNEVQTTKAILSYYQIGNKKEDKPVLYVIEQILFEPFFSQLRTKEQLGYCLYSYFTDRWGGVQGMFFIIQSQFSTQYLEGRIEAFLDYGYKYIADMSEEDFEKEKTSVITKLLEKERNHHEFASFLWDQITKREYDFDFKVKLIEDIKLLKKTDILKVFVDNLCCEASGRRKLTVRINRDKPEENLLEPTEEAKKGITPGISFMDPVLIDDPESFKKSLSLYPVPEPKRWN